MNAENPIILSPEEIKEKMLITIVGKDGKQKNFFVMEVDKENKARYYGFDEYYILKHPEIIGCSTAQMKSLSYVDGHKELRHTTTDYKKQFKGLSVKNMGTYIREHPGVFVKRNNETKNFIESIPVDI